MISISVSCEENEIPALKELLAGIFAKSAGIVEVAAPAPELRVLPDLIPGPNPAIESAKQFEQEQAALNKIEQITKPKIIRSVCDLSMEAKQLVARLHGEGKTMDEIKAATGITDGRIINGVLARGKKKPRLGKLQAEAMSVINPAGQFTNRSPAPTFGSVDVEKAKALRDQGASRYETARTLGVEPTEVKKVYVAESKAEDIQEQAEKVAELKPMGLTSDVVNRILDLDRSKLTPRSISDTLEEERGLVVSTTEVMDVIVRNQKNLL